MPACWLTCNFKSGASIQLCHSLPWPFDPVVAATRPAALSPLPLASILRSVSTTSSVAYCNRGSRSVSSQPTTISPAANCPLKRERHLSGSDSTRSVLTSKEVSKPGVAKEELEETTMQLTRAKQRPNRAPLALVQGLHYWDRHYYTKQTASPLKGCPPQDFRSRQPKQPIVINRIVSQVYVFRTVKSKAQKIAKKSGRLTSKTRGLA